MRTGARVKAFITKTRVNKTDNCINCTCLRRPSHNTASLCAGAHTGVNKKGCETTTRVLRGGNFKGHAQNLHWDADGWLVLHSGPRWSWEWIQLLLSLTSTLMWNGTNRICKNIKAAKSLRYLMNKTFNYRNNIKNNTARNAENSTLRTDREGSSSQS